MSPLYTVFLPTRCVFASPFTQPLPSVVETYTSRLCLTASYCSCCSNSILQTELNSLLSNPLVRYASPVDHISWNSGMTWCYFGCLRVRYYPPAKSCPPSSPISRRGGARRPRRYDTSKLRQQMRSRFDGFALPPHLCLLLLRSFGTLTRLALAANLLEGHRW